MALFFVKIHPDRRDQIEGRYIAAGPENSPWYGKIVRGDLVFPIFRSFVRELWRLQEYRSVKLPTGEETYAAFFERIDSAFIQGVRISDEFIRNRWGCLKNHEND
jgi:hypothetical protein